MATRLSPEGHSGNIPAKHTPLLIFLILNPHIGVKVEDIFEPRAEEFVEVWENIFEDHLINLPDHVTVHEGEIEDARVLWVGKLHLH